MRREGSARWWALAALAISVLVVGVDLTVLNVALPTLATALHATTSQLQWFVDSYSLVLAAALLPAGMLGDRFGRRKLLLVALAVFGISSAVCAYATSATALIATRAVLGIGAAVIIPLSVSVLTVLFERDERPKAMAVVMAATMIGYPLGPVLGGWLLTRYWWGAVFLMNVPVIVLAMIAVALLMPESRGGQTGRLDVGGIAVSSLGLAGLTYGVIEAGQRGWGDTRSIAAMVAGAGALVAFVLWEQRPMVRSQKLSRTPAREPLIDLGLFRSAEFTLGTLLATMVSFAMFGLLFAMPLYFQDVAGHDSLGSGVRLLPLVAGLVVGGSLASRLQSPRKDAAGVLMAPPRLDARAAITIGFGLIAAGLLLGARTGLHTGSAYAAAWFVVVGLGLGFALPAAMNAALGALSGSRAGVGSALIMALRQVGATFGVAILGTLINSVYRGRLHLGGLPAAAATAAQDSVSAGVAAARRLGSAPLLDSVRGAFVHALDVMLVVCAGIAVAALLVALAFLPRSRPALPTHAEPAEAGADDSVRT